MFNQQKFENALNGFKQTASIKANDIEASHNLAAS